mgnify:CR=1 FL=1
MNKIDLITRNLEEVLTKNDLVNLVNNKERLVHYIGFEISGFLHLGTGLMSMLKVVDFQKAAIKCQIFLADWHSYINDKLTGDLKTIQKIAVGYYKEGFSVCLEALGGNSQKIDFILGSDLYHNNDKYWLTFIEISKNTTLSRVQRSIDIMGRKEKDIVDFAKLCYPLMQVADIFLLRANLVHAGLDQRKAHVIARDVALNLSYAPLLDKKKNKIKPIALHHHILLGLQQPPKYPITKEEIKEMPIDLKMSKSKPDSCIFIHDSPEEIEKKILKAFCPPNDVEYNPPLDWIYWLILPIKKEIKIKTSNGIKIYKEDKKNILIEDYKKGEIHPLDLKEALVRELISIIEPIFKHFNKGTAKKLKGELENIKK